MDFLQTLMGKGNEFDYNRRNRSGTWNHYWCFNRLVLDFLQMNTHDIDIELPLLPRPQVPLIDADIDLMDARRLVNWCEKTANEHARAAVAADRQRRGEPFIYLRTLNGKPDWAEDCVSEHESDLIQDIEMCDEGYGVMPLYVAPQPAEPNGYVVVSLRDIKAWRNEWLEANDPGDGTDCVTPFDKYLYNQPRRNRDV